MITSKATLVLQALHTPELRAKASEKARNHGNFPRVLCSSTCGIL